jgi:acetate kinase
VVQELLLTFNAGSSTLKLGVYVVEALGARCIGKAVVDFQQQPPTLQLAEGAEKHTVALAAVPTEDLHEVMDEVLGRLSEHFNMSAIRAAGHRLVHGGDTFHNPVLIDEAAEQDIEALVPLAPLHQLQALRLIRAVRHLQPHLMQSASFDTSFHMTNSDLVRRFALPCELHDSGVKRYGFHGLSYSFIARELTRVAPAVARRKVVTAHLGSGCSLCGLDEGLSRDTSMGFSTLDGVPMATRCGALDPGVLLHLLSEKRLAPADIEDLLYKRSGLLGVSGISGDTRVLFQSVDERAKLALDLFAFRTAGEAARIVNTLGGIDAFVFTAGIGEHQPEIRAAIASHLGWLGLEIDEEANQAGNSIISSSSSRVLALVIATDEEQVIANDARDLLRSSGSDAI